MVSLSIRSEERRGGCGCFADEFVHGCSVWVRDEYEVLFRKTKKDWCLMDC